MGFSPVSLVPLEMHAIPGLGRAFIAITNFHDGLLIKIKNGNYIITPKDSMGFKEAIETTIR